MKRTIAICCAGLLALGLWTAVGQGQQGGAIRSIMKVKLKHAQKVLEGLALEDYKQIQQSAKTLEVLSRAAEWKVHKSAEYLKFSGEFRQIAVNMQKHAKEKNLDGATLDYLQMTMTCVACHKHVRDIVIAQGDVPPPLPNITLAPRP